jgi:branched-chain amino acid transport system ATP-binding protein
MFALRGVSAGYGSVRVLRDIDVVVPGGTVVALLGANGAGKTTLLRVASGLLKPSSGHIDLDGRDVTGYSPHALVAAGVCHIPEGRGIFRNMTVQDNLLTFSPAGSEDASIERAVHAFPKLGQRLGQVAGTMSGGEQQMLALARAYIQKPRVVLLDEVSMGLAPIIIDEIFEFLALLVSEGAALLLVEQYVTRALKSADIVYMLSRGSVTFAGQPTELAEDAVFASYVGGSAL